jgi:hypothetical protein
LDKKISATTAHAFRNLSEMRFQPSPRIGFLSSSLRPDEEFLGTGIFVARVPSQGIGDYRKGRVMMSLTE